MLPPFSKVPALPVAIGIVAGILLWVAHFGWVIPCVAIVAGVILIFRGYHYFAFLFYAVAVGWGISALHAPAPPPEGIFDGEKRTFSAVISAVRTNPESQSLTLRVDSIADRGGEMHACRSFSVSASLLPDWSLSPGRIVRIDAVLEPIGCHPDFPHDSDYSMLYLHRGEVARTFIDDANIHPVGVERSFRRWLWQRREAVIRLLAHSGLSADAFSLVAAITVGYDDMLAPSLEENFRSAGIAHALALSGFHVGVIVLIVSVVLFPLRVFYRLRRWRMGLSLALVWFYALMVGMPPSVVRAVVMLSIVILARMAGRETSSFNSLCVAVAVILAAEPFCLFSVGFQLSVSAVIGILALARPLNPVNPRNYLAYRAVMLVAIPLAAIAGTMVVTASVFHRLPLLFGVSNLIISFLLPPLMFAGIGVIALTSIGLKAAWLCNICDWISRLIESVAESLASFAWSDLSGIYLSGWQVAAVAVAIALIMVGANFPRRRLMAPLAVGFMLCLTVFSLSAEDVPPSEEFVMSDSSFTAIVRRTGSKMTAHLTCHPRRLDNAARRLRKRLDNYMISRGVDSLHISLYDSSPIVVNNRRIMLLTSSGLPDSIPGPVDVAVVCSRFRGDLESVVGAVRPDTIVLSRDLSLRRSVTLQKTSTLPVIDLRHSPFPR